MVLTYLPFIDKEARLKALAHTRLKFRENEKVTDMTKIEELIAQAEQAKVYIEENVVQGIKKGASAFSTRTNLRLQGKQGE